MGIKILSIMKIKLGKTADVINALKSMSVVKEIFYITGEYDIAILMEGESETELNENYLNQIDKIEGIDNSVSHLVIKHWMLRPHSTAINDENKK